MSEKILNREFPKWRPSPAQISSAGALVRLLDTGDAFPVVDDAGSGFLLGENEDTALLFVRIGEGGIPKEPSCAPRVWQALEQLFRRSVRESACRLRDDLKKRIREADLDALETPQLRYVLALVEPQEDA